MWTKNYLPFNDDVHAYKHIEKKRRILKTDHFAMKVQK